MNVLSAGREVLLALPDIAPPTVDRILALRRNPKEAPAQEVMALLGKQQEVVKAQPGPSDRVRVEARRDGARSRSIEAVPTASRSPDALFYVIEWTE